MLSLLCLHTHQTNACSSSCPTVPQVSTLCPLGPLGNWVRLDSEVGEEVSSGFQGVPWIPPLATVWAIQTIFTETSCPAWAGLLQQLYPLQYRQDPTARRATHTQLGTRDWDGSSLSQPLPLLLPITLLLPHHPHPPALCHGFVSCCFCCLCVYAGTVRNLQIGDNRGNTMESAGLFICRGLCQRGILLPVKASREGGACGSQTCKSIWLNTIVQLGHRPFTVSDGLA